MIQFGISFNVEGVHHKAIVNYSAEVSPIRIHVHSIEPDLVDSPKAIFIQKKEDGSFVGPIGLKTETMDEIVRAIIFVTGK